MDAISHVARVLGIEWAEQTLSKLERRRCPVPTTWPGTGTDAFAIVSSSGDLPIDPADRDRLAFEVLRVAKDTWRELMMPE
jgi:hypothetical protein